VSSEDEEEEIEFPDDLVTEPPRARLASKQHAGMSHTEVTDIQRLFGTPLDQTIDPELCFVMMPFGGQLDEAWEDVIRTTVSGVGLKPVRADGIYGTGAIMRDVWIQIVRSRILVADLTGKNPNVFYELGLAHALGRDVVLLSQSMDDVPFDLRHLHDLRHGVR